MSLIYFTKSLKATGSNENLFWLSTFWQCWFRILEFSLISHVEAAFYKKVFNSAAIFFSSGSTSSFSTSFILLPELPLFVKNGLAVIIMDKRGISFVKEFFMLPFVKPATIIFLLFVRSQGLVRSFFEIKTFKHASFSVTCVSLIYLITFDSICYKNQHFLLKKKHEFIIKILWIEELVYVEMKEHY